MRRGIKVELRRSQTRLRSYELHAAQVPALRAVRFTLPFIPAAPVKRDLRFASTSAGYSGAGE
jgi:hypothetical protein